MGRGILIPETSSRFGGVNFRAVGLALSPVLLAGLVLGVMAFTAPLDGPTAEPGPARQETQAGDGPLDEAMASECLDELDCLAGHDALPAVG